MLLNVNGFFQEYMYYLNIKFQNNESNQMKNEVKHDTESKASWTNKG